MKNKRQTLGTLLVGGSAVIYGVSPTLMKITFAYGGNGLLSTFYTGLFALPVLWLWTRLSRHSLRLDRQTAGRLAILALSTGVTAILLYSSYAYIPVGMSTTLHYIYPVAAAFYLACFYRERLQWWNVVSLILAVGGIVCVSASQLRGGNVLGVCMAVASGLTWAFYIVYVEKSGLTLLPPEVLNFYTGLSNALFAAVMCFLLQGGVGLYTEPLIWLLVLFNGILHRVAANAMFHVGVRFTSALTASIISTFEPVVSVLVSAFLLREGLSALQTLGLFLVLGGILFSVALNHRHSPAG